MPARRLQAHVLVQQHRFAEAAALAEPLARETGDWSTWIVVGDALIEQGEVDGAAMAYQEAADHRPGLVVYDRISHLRYTEGDVQGAREAATWAVESGSAADAEPYAWALSWLGWLKVLNREPAPELDAALQLVPGYAPALLNRGRARLHEDGPAHDPRGGGADLRSLPHNLEAARHFVIELPRWADPRGWADATAPWSPAASLAVLDEELKTRRDPVTRAMRAWALFHAGRQAEAEAEARAVLATAHPDPRLLHHAALILRDRPTAERALWMGAGITQAERDELRAMLAE
ncbi:MAG: tetratricopeptide repeat protein [Deltaproteobacteria bacterium]|nr:tetratricopeptide repeat protein [Deltaproteobacteria bacterium]